MRGEHDRSLELFERFLQPADGFGVEMVGRFVQEQEVGCRDQGASQCDSPFFPPGQGAYRTIHGRSGEKGGGIGGTGLKVPAICQIDFFQ